MIWIKALAHVNEWTKSFVIRKPGFIIKVDDVKNAPANNITSGITNHSTGVSKKQYYNINDLIENVYKTEKKPCVPDYLPQGFELNKALYEKYEDEKFGDFNLTLYFKGKNSTEDTIEYMNVIINYKNEGSLARGATYYTDSNREAKAIKIGEEDAILIKEKKEDLKSIYRLECIMVKYPVNISVEYRGYREDTIVEDEIIKVTKALVGQIEKEVPERNVEIKNISKIIEKDNEKELYKEIYQLDDRIVEISNIPEGYKFEKGRFFDNNGYIASEYHGTYRKNDSTLGIGIYYHNQTSLGSDFTSSEIGEIEKRESLLGHEMRLYKERKGLLDHTDIVRAISVSIPDYAMVINISTEGPKDQIVTTKELEKIAIDIIQKVKQKSEKRKTVSAITRVKVYDNIKHLKESQEIASKGFVVPSYLPKGYEFMRARYYDDSYTKDGYKLVLYERIDSHDNKLPAIIAISESEGDITDTFDGPHVVSIDEITIKGYKGYIVKEKHYYTKDNTEKSTDVIRLEVEIPQKNHLIRVTMDYVVNEDDARNILVKIVKSMLVQID